MTTTEAAQFLGIHRSRVHQLVRAGLLPAEHEDTPRGPVLWFREADLAGYQQAAAAENEQRRGKPGRPKKVRPDARPRTRAKVVNGRVIHPPKPLPELEGLPPAVQALIREVDRGLAEHFLVKYHGVIDWEPVAAEVRRRLVAAFEGKGLTTLPKKTAAPKTDEGGQPS